ncbi:MAG: transcription-repair coupling factor [Clostridia bacterium]|nr:transcription-repair coupling factor [Clostridia bacterium]
MIEISTLIREDREFSEYERTLLAALSKPKAAPISVSGLSGGAEDALIVESVHTAALRSAGTLVLLPTEAECERVHSMLTLAGIYARRLPPREPIYYNISASHDVDRERLSVLHALTTGECPAVVATPAAALSYTLSRGELASRTVSLRVSGECSPESLITSLTGMGFARVDSVEERGQYAHRGGIVDFWSEEQESPVRVEFFGDEIDRMVYFDPLSQRSVENVENITVLPAREVVANGEARERMKTIVDKLLASKRLSEGARAKLVRERDAINNAASLEFADKYIRAIYEGGECLVHYLGEGALILAVGTSALRDSLSRYLSAKKKEIAALVAEGLAHPDMIEPLFTDELFGDGFPLTVHINTFGGSLSGELSGLFGFRCRRAVAYGDNPSMLFEDILAYRKAGYSILLGSPTRAGAEATRETLSEYGIEAIAVYEKEDFKPASMKAGAVYITVSSHAGFELIGPRIAYLSLAKDEGRAVMARKRQQRINRRLRGTSQRIMSHAELSVGDYVVHANYGIGLFEGISTVTVDGVTRDYVTIKYAGTDKLFVPCDTLDAVGRYIGERERDGSVKLSKMGGTEWHKAKSRAKGAARDIAKQLIALYAERQRRPGYSFPRNAELEDEFNSQFEFQETPSQLAAEEEIKADMARSVPMNRLLCGDVGFGKTEVALRAAFLAVLAGKQVAILAPTTILALQHYQTALSRMRGYAVNVRMLSRLVSTKEKNKILSELERGRVDILIGTHTIISKTTKFRDLGLLIIDEEQRFGVVQKERLREMSTNVDTLLLSATPIPRTLNMAMSGISDISVLDEAPGERRPVQTYVLEHDEAVVHEAIRRELDRGGQVFYLYNKVEDIEFVADKIMLAFPSARVAVAHGQMEKGELEDIWQNLVRCEIDVLVCTTIVETGVDLPSANTLIIENADRFGLSQLHQIRGRVGRSKRQAYAYLTYRPGKALSEIAEKRLTAIKDYAEFGAGFKLALCDLEIRGAGNLLGAEQHGHIESVGYDLYIKLLNEAVLEERGEERVQKEVAQVAINVSANIPESYISAPSSRMEMYKKIAEIETKEDRDEVFDELLDRFGDIPRTVVRLLDISLTRALATAVGFKRVELSGGRVVFHAERPDLAAWSEVFAAHSALGFLGPSSPLVAYRLGRGEDPTAAAARVMIDYFEAYSAIAEEKRGKNE